MKYYVGDIVYDVYSSAWHDKRKRAFMIKHSDVTVKLHKRGLSDILKRL